MKASELRVGNYVKVLGKERIIEGISNRTQQGQTTFHHYVEFKSLIPIKIIHLKPIPITEEWLIELGFKKDYVGLWVINDMSFEFYINRLELTWYENAPCEYVHQLQNLYFALTGDEINKL